MGSSVQLSPPSLLPTKLRRNLLLINRSPPSRYCRATTNHKRFRIFSLVSSSASNREVSWIPIEGNSTDDYGGWSVNRNADTESENGIPKFVLACVGASVAVLLAVFSYSTFSKKGFKFQIGFPVGSFRELLMSFRTSKVLITETSVLECDLASETNMDVKSHRESDLSKTKVNYLSAPRGNNCITIRVPADPFQQEALDVLKKLKIVEDGVSADDLCTRREYARWFVKANSLLERNPKYKIAPMISTAGPMIVAFDDVSIDDPDFWCIQALGEAGIIFSKLSTINTSSLSDITNLDGQERFEFSPERLVSRLDLVNWKTMLEYPFDIEVKEEMLRMKVGMLDLGANTVDASPQLLMDLMAGDRSIIRRVFGNIRRLQPQKPVTKAQAAVALANGRMAEAIKSELSRLEAESQSRLAEMEEIRSELVRRGEIQRIWEERLNNEKERRVQVERDTQIVLLELEMVKMTQNEDLAEYMKEKSFLDYKRQLLSSLTKEVDGLHDRLASERANILSEQQSLDELSAVLQKQQAARIEAKSILEAEKEALRILRYWVLKEARKIQSRGKTLEQAAQRWKWNPDSANLD